MKTFLSLSSTLLGWIVWINHGKKYEFLCSNFCPCRRYFDLYCETFACERDNEKLIFSDSMKIVQFFPPMFGFCACSCEKVTTTKRAEMFFRSFTGCDCMLSECDHNNRDWWHIFPHPIAANYSILFISCWPIVRFDNFAGNLFDLNISTINLQHW